MISHLSNLNWLSVALAFFAYSILGALWFTLFFTRLYKVSLGKAGQNLQNNAPIFIAGPVLCTLFITLASAVLISALDLRTLGDALEFTLVAGVGFLVANTVNIAINPNIPRPILYGAISGTYHLAGILLASCIIVFMK